MIFLPLLIIGIILYFSGKRVLSALIFFFFLSDGFNLAPEFLFETGMGFSKSIDFSLLYVLFICMWGVFVYRDFIPKDKLTLAIGVFLAFLLISIGVSKSVFHVDWNSIFRTCRYFFFVLSYFVFRRFSKEEIIQTLHILFLITLVLSILYIAQGLIGIPILNGSTAKVRIGSIYRFYNIPFFYYFFVFYGMFFNPLKGTSKIASMAILIFVMIMSMNRGMMVPLFLLIFYGIYITQGGFKGVFLYLLIGGILSIPVIGVIVERFEEKSSSDVENVIQGAFMDYGDELSIDGTFLFRMALLYERIEYIVEDNTRCIFGVGFMTEDSKITEKTFEFHIGLKDELTGKTIQLDTSDIAWSNLFLRFGFVGTIIYLYLYLMLGRVFYKDRLNRISLVTLLFIIFSLLSSFTSSLLYDTRIIIFPILGYILIALEKEEDVKSNDQNELP